MVGQFFFKGWSLRRRGEREEGKSIRVSVDARPGQQLLK
jgi:hypothetical protein